MMSTISVETTARLTICWIASSRSAAVFLPSPGTLLTRAARIAWKKPTSSRIAAGRIARRRQRECLGERQHRIGIPAMRPLLAVVGGLLGGVRLLQGQHPVDGTGHDGETRLRASPRHPAPVGSRTRPWCRAGTWPGRSRTSPAAPRTASASSMPVCSRSPGEYWPSALFRFWAMPM